MSAPAALLWLLLAVCRGPAPAVAQRTGTATSGTGQSASGPHVHVGTGVHQLVPAARGTQQVSAGTAVRGGGGTSFGRTSIHSNADQAGALPLRARSTSTLVSTQHAALGTSQASSHHIQLSATPGVPSEVTGIQVS